MTASALRSSRRSCWRWNALTPCCKHRQETLWTRRERNWCVLHCLWLRFFRRLVQDPTSTVLWLSPQWADSANGYLCITLITLEWSVWRWMHRDREIAWQDPKLTSVPYTCSMTSENREPCKCLHFVYSSSRIEMVNTGLVVRLLCDRVRGCVVGLSDALLTVLLSVFFGDNLCSPAHFRSQLRSLCFFLREESSCSRIWLKVKRGLTNWSGCCPVLTRYLTHRGRERRKGEGREGEWEGIDQMRRRVGGSGRGYSGMKHYMRWRQEFPGGWPGEDAAHKLMYTSLPAG